jgi:uncharacterized protein YaeQ
MAPDYHPYIQHYIGFHSVSGANFEIANEKAILKILAVRVHELSTFSKSRNTLNIPIFTIQGQIMAQKATICKVELSVADMDRDYYETHNLTVAKHPSETDERLMARILAFALNAHEQLEFTRGISTDDEPDIWQKSLSGELELWVTLGLPGEKIDRQSCGKANEVIVYCYGGRTAEMWWEKIKTSTTRFDNLQVTNFSKKDTSELGKMASRLMKLQVNIQDGDVMVSIDDNIVYVTPVKWKDADH